MVAVRVSETLTEQIAATYGPQRPGGGTPSEWDFWTGPLAAALVGFRDFHSLPFDLHPEVRHLHVVDPVFGVVLFAGVLIDPDVVEIADYAIDRDYWDLIGDDPND